jgi:disulfide bond formation protein DsbB
VKYGSLLWSSTHQIAPTATYTKAPTSAPAPSAVPRTSPSESVTAQQPALGFNWVPWAVGAAGLALVVFVVRGR